MLVPIMLLILSTCVVADRNEVVTLQGILRQYCQANYNNGPDQHEILRGPPGPRGSQGRPGKRGGIGPMGPTGPAGLVNDSRVRDIFKDSLESVFRSMNWSAFIGVRLESCQDIRDRLAALPSIKSGIYNIYQPDVGWTNVYCDLDVGNQEWTVFQRRMDGSVNFYRGWTDYVNGFGIKTGEFWLGLEEIHRLTNSGRHDLRIDMIDTEGIHHTAKYSEFKIGSANENYRLSVSGYSGNATDSLGYHNGREFSTKNNDHDGSMGRNCAMVYKGAWWYSGCYWSSLNGMYNNNDWNGIVWRDRDHDERMMNMRFTEMKFRRRI